MDSEHSWTNYTNSTTGLFNGGAGYLEYSISPTFIVSGAVTIADGGNGGAHPFLSETLPSYIGAENPDDNDWIEGLYGLASVSYLTAITTDDPIWIEGATTDTTPPSYPTGLSVEEGNKFSISNQFPMSKFSENWIPFSKGMTREEITKKMECEITNVSTDVSTCVLT